ERSTLDAPGRAEAESADGAALRHGGADASGDRGDKAEKQAKKAEQSNAHSDSVDSPPSRLPPSGSNGEDHGEGDSRGSSGKSHSTRVPSGPLVNGDEEKNSGHVVVVIP